jgi:PAS domain S-box-containing protein
MRLGPLRSGLLGYVASLGLVALALAAAKAFPLFRHLPDPSLLFLMAAFACAMIGGAGPAALGVVASVLVYDFFFVEPLYTLSVDDPRDLVSLAVFSIVAMLTSRMTSRLREQAEAAREREERTAALYGLARDTVTASGLSELLPIVAAHVARALSADVIVSLREHGKLQSRASFPPGLALSAEQLAAAEQAWSTGGVASLAATMPPSGWQHVSLDTARGEVAVLSLRLQPDSPQLSPERRHFLAALAQQAAVAIERCRMDRTLAEKSRTEQVIEASDDGIVVVDAGGSIVHVNEIACTILGVERSRLIGFGFTSLGTTHPHALRLRHAVEQFFRKPDGEAERLEITVFLRGRDHHYVLRLTPYRMPGESEPGLIMALQDVTYVRDQEARRENLVATLSHELRTPLTSLRMAIERLRPNAAKLGENSRQCIDTAYEDVIRLQDVSQQFLDLARTRAMAIGVHRRPVEVRELVARVVRMFALQADERGVALESPEIVSTSLMADENKLSWALSNLVGNAIRHTPAGGSVRVDARAADHSVFLAVTDTGGGIPADQRGRVFERFAQGGVGEETGASGLGLSIVREIVQAHGGRVHLDSVMGRGTCFTLELPVD